MSIGYKCSNRVQEFMSRHRNGELGAVPLRSGRFLLVDGKWYFCCREGRDQGPYPSKSEAENALQNYIRELGPSSTPDYPGASSESPLPGR